MERVSPQFIIEGLMRRGYPAHVAQGFVMNMMDESGLRPGVNEAAPIVPGSRGGFGLYQLTGPRRIAYEQFAAQRGVNPADPNAQLDFLDYEMRGPESRAAKSILSTSNPQEAAVAIARDFLRPASEHLQNRVARYSGADVAADTMAALGKGGGAVTPDQIAQAAQAQSTGMQGQQQPRGLLGGFFGNPDNMAALAIALNSMRLNPDPALAALLSGQMKERRSEKKAQEQQNKTIAYFKKLADAGNAQAARALSYVEATGDVSGALKMATAQPQVQDPYSTIGKLQADLAAGRINEEQYNIAVQGMAPTGMSIETTPDGGIRLVQGAGVTQKPFTEGQSKDVVFATRAAGALETLEPVADALTSLGERAAGADPTGIIRGAVQSENFQVAKAAGDEFLQAILRKDTGAAITAQEQELYGKTYLPQPGDGPAVLEQKRQARQRALSALGAGMSPTQMLAVERGLQTKGAAPAQTGAKPTHRYNPQTGQVEVID